MGAKDVANPVILWGDSHAAALVHVLGEQLKVQNLSGLYVRNRACRNIPGTYLVGEPAAARV
ncbi:MAG: hypothetical protein HC855_17010, partial [Rhizobiales bacterium]|nr:hypothetical protein [Hyphomicrobiales bacterium]